jgi:hypothetical protein
MEDPSLRELQARFWEAIVKSPGEVDAAPQLLALVPATVHLDPSGRLAIYAEMYWHRILDVLREDFSRTAETLGDGAFTAVARHYLELTPSRSPSIARVGAGFARFLAEHPPAGAPPFAADLARLEWARIEAFAAPDAEALRLSDLRDLPAEEWQHLRLRTVPSLSVHVFDWPVHRLLADSLRGTITAEPTVVRVWRMGALVFQASMDATERAALRRARSRSTFAGVGEVCRDAALAAALLARWLEDGIVARNGV